MATTGADWVGRLWKFSAALIVAFNIWRIWSNSSDPVGTDANPVFTSRWPRDTPLDAFVFVSRRPPSGKLAPDFANDDLVWSKTGFSREGLGVERLNVTWTPSNVKGNVSSQMPVWLHAFVMPTNGASGLLTASDSEVLVKHMEAFSEDELRDLWDVDSSRAPVDKSAPVDHWKAKIDVRLVGTKDVALVSELARLPGAHRLKADGQQRQFTPLCWVHDFWMLERHFVPLHELTAFQIELSFGIQPQWTHGFIANMKANWEADPGDRPLAGLHQHTRRELLMIKRILMDTNRYFLAFSAVFMSTHVLFQLLALKNDVAFWRSKEGMEGLSAYALIYGFVSELIIALYLLDSNETSRLILMEILLGLGTSAWKLTKGVKIRFSRQFPFVLFADQERYEESGTKAHDVHAIKTMSVVMLPVCLAYTVYSYFYKKHRSVYSFVVSSLAGMVYAFGFVMMCPQLYINYKLKSVDHMPWRAMIYRALDTFVDDVSAFLVDMPLLHRLAVFRDDVIFVLYLYQRWIYRVDKTRATAWNQGQGVEREEVPDATDSPAKDLKEVPAANKSTESAVRQRR